MQSPVLHLCDQDENPANCWLVLRESQQRQERFVAQNKATAWMMLEHYMHEAEEAEPIPTHLLLLWCDERGREHIRINVHIGPSAI